MHFLFKVFFSVSYTLFVIHFNDFPIGFPCQIGIEIVICANDRPPTIYLLWQC